MDFKVGDSVRVNPQVDKFRLETFNITILEGKPLVIVECCPLDGCHLRFYKVAYLDSNRNLAELYVLKGYLLPLNK